MLATGHPASAVSRSIADFVETKGKAIDFIDQGDNLPAKCYIVPLPHHQKLIIKSVDISSLDRFPANNRLDVIIQAHTSDQYGLYTIEYDLNGVAQNIFIAPGNEQDLDRFIDLIELGKYNDTEKLQERYQDYMLMVSRTVELHSQGLTFEPPIF